MRKKNNRRCLHNTEPAGLAVQLRVAEPTRQRYDQHLGLAIGFVRPAYFRAAGCLSGSQAPFSLLLLTHCWMKYIPSTPS